MANVETESWDLSHLIDLEAAGIEVNGSAGDDEAAVNALLDEGDRLSDSFAGDFEGKIGELDAAGLRGAMERLAQLSEIVGRALNFATPIAVFEVCGRTNKVCCANGTPLLFLAAALHSTAAAAPTGKSSCLLVVEVFPCMPVLQAVGADIVRRQHAHSMLQVLSA